MGRAKHLTQDEKREVGKWMRKVERNDINNVDFLYLVCQRRNKGKETQGKDRKKKRKEKKRKEKKSCW